MCGTRIEKKKDVRARKDDGIEAGPLFSRSVIVQFVPIWQDSLDTVFRDIARSWPMAILHMYKEPMRMMVMITLKVASWWSLVAAKLAHVWICIEWNTRGRNSRELRLSPLSPI
jgi:hypothetical protein